jgi:hypothetical protein
VPTFRITEQRTEIWTHEVYVDADSEAEARRLWEALGFNHDDPDPEPEHQWDVDRRLASIVEE